MILVTGGTGAIGSELLRLLSQAGVPARALTRSVQKAQNLPGVTWVVGDLARPETLAASFSDMRWNLGFGLRAWAKGLVVRLDAAISDEDFGVQMMVGHPFQF